MGQLTGDFDKDLDYYAELLRRPENDTDFTAFRIGGPEEHRLDETNVEMYRCVPLKHRERIPHGWSSCDLVFYLGGVSARLNGLVAEDLTRLGQALIDYAHRLRNY